MQVRLDIGRIQASNPEVDQLKQKRRKAARTLLKPELGPAKPPAKRKHLVDGKLVDRLPFNANGNPISNLPVVLAEQAQAEPT